MVLRSKEMVESGDLDNFGKLLHENWQLKSISDVVSNKEIDDLYSKALKNGALGGKLRSRIRWFFDVFC